MSHEVELEARSNLCRLLQLAGIKLIQVTRTAVCPHHQPATCLIIQSYFRVINVEFDHPPPQPTPPLPSTFSRWRICLLCLAPRSKRPWRNLRTRSASWMLHGTLAGAVTPQRSSRRGTFQEACFSTSMASPTRLCLCPTCEQIVRLTARLTVDGKPCDFEEAGPRREPPTAVVARNIDAMKSCRGLVDAGSESRTCTARVGLLASPRAPDELRVLTSTTAVGTITIIHHTVHIP